MSKMDEKKQLLNAAVATLYRTHWASGVHLMRCLGINRKDASKLMDELKARGIIRKEEGSARLVVDIDKAREYLLTLSKMTLFEL